MRIVAGGDVGHQWTQHGTYAAELASYVELLELSPLEALLTATTDAGPVAGERLGQIREGHLADLVVLDGDPTADIRLLLDADRVGPVIKAGVPVAGPGWSRDTAWASVERGASPARLQDHRPDAVRPVQRGDPVVHLVQRDPPGHGATRGRACPPRPAG